ncbi:MAG TPA: oligosaccharide flippase family protein [Anaerolineaceae bacterium]|nr:oligosaccharide flippase family protein [Anaerolineaceae bacterium]
MRSVLAKAAGEWRKDLLLRRVTRNSSYLLASNVISAVLSLVAAKLLGVASFGVLGTTIGFVTAINQLLSFRMGDLVVRYLGEAVAKGEGERGAAVVKAAGLAEGATSLLTYGLLLLLTPLATQYIIKDAQASWLLPYYGLTILANITTETATGVLQVGNKYRSQALINLVQAVLTAVIVGCAYATRAGLFVVVTAYLAGKLVSGLGPIVLAWIHLKKQLGPGWLRARFALLPPWREMTRFGLSTNLSGTINLFARNSEVLWVSFFFGPLQAGYYKAALAIINLVIMPINPFISTSYPEITRAVVTREWGRLRSLLRRVSLIAGGWTAAVGMGLVLLGWPVLFQPWTLPGGRQIWLYGAEYGPAYPVLLVLLVGFGFANIFFWNRSLLLAFDEPDYPLKVAFWAMLAKVALAFVLVPKYGYLAEAGLLSLYFLVTVGLILWRGLAHLREQEVLETAGLKA